MGDLTGLGAVLAVIISLVSTSGLVYWVVNYRRDDTGKVVQQWNNSVQAQAGVVGDLRGLIDELQEALKRVRDERDTLVVEVAKCREEIQHLKGEVRALREVLETLGHVHDS